MFETHCIGEGLGPQEYLQKQLKKERLLVAIGNLGEVKVMRDIGPECVNRLISFRGIVVRTSDVVPEMKRAVFKCVRCDD